MNVIIPTLIIAAAGLFFGLVLGIVSKVFEVKKDERIDKIAEILPGANCGGCGFAGCSAYAEEIVLNGAEVNCCSVGGADAAAKISAVMGKEAGEFVRKTARVMCNGNCENAKTKYIYSGIKDCFAASRVADGQKECIYGCLGFGNCVEACEFGALSIVDGVARVDPEKCAACGKCVVRCPKKLIKLLPYDKTTSVLCSNRDKGAVARTVCDVSCIGCGICAKNCPNEAITVTDFLAGIDYEKCVDCGICSEKCPRHAIIRK